MLAGTALAGRKSYAAAVPDEVVVGTVVPDPGSADL